jgi:hypothetical protein
MMSESAHAATDGSGRCKPESLESGLDFHSERDTEPGNVDELDRTALPDKAKTDGIDSLMDQIGCSSAVFCSSGEDLARKNRGRNGEEEAESKEKKEEKKGGIRMELRNLMKRNAAGVKRNW